MDWVMASMSGDLPRVTQASKRFSVGSFDQTISGIGWIVFPISGLFQRLIRGASLVGHVHSSVFLPGLCLTLLGVSR
jgi:hypothetical protein